MTRLCYGCVVDPQSEVQTYEFKWIWYASGMSTKPLSALYFLQFRVVPSLLVEPATSAPLPCTPTKGAKACGKLTG